MYKEFYQLDSEPFRLTPDPRFVFAHRSYQKAHAYMRHALEQGDGFLVITGRPGTGKTTLAEDLLTGLSSDEVYAATLTFTQLEVDDLLRMVAYAFNINAKGLDKATLLRELVKSLEKKSRALLIIDEAQNLSPAALEEVRMLTNLHVRSQPILQIFLLGQEELRQRLHKPEMEHLHQRLMAACDLKPLSLQETQAYVLHRLNCAGWRGDPAISAAAFVLIHRFSQGLPRYINKLCARLFLHGAQEQRHLLDLDDLVTVIKEIQDELLLPLVPEQEAGVCEPFSDMQALISSSSSLSADWMEYLTTEEQAFIQSCPDVAEPAPTELLPPATLENEPAVIVLELGADTAHRKQAVRDRSESELVAIVTRDDVYERPVRSRRRWKGIRNRKILGYGLAVPILLIGVYVLGFYSDIQQHLPIGTGSIVTRVERESVLADPAVTEPYSPNPKAREALVLVEPRQEETGHVDGFSEIENKAKAPNLAEHIVAPPVLDSGLLETQEVTEQVVAKLSQEMATSEVDSLAGSQGERQEPPALNSTPLESSAVTDSESADLVAQSKETTANSQIEALLLLAKQAVAKDRLGTPKQQSGWHYYKQVLKLDPGNRDALRGLEQIAQRYGDLASSLMDKQQYEKAQMYINRGLGVVVGHSRLRALQGEIQIQQEALKAIHERDLLLTLQASDAEAERRSTGSEQKPVGFFSAVKKLFADAEVQSPEQLYQANDH